MPLFRYAKPDTVFTFTTDFDGNDIAHLISESFNDIFVPKVKRIIFHNPATIVFWEDGTKTVVKCMKDQEYSKYYGFLAALGKKIYKNNSHLQHIIEEYGVEED